MAISLTHIVALLPISLTVPKNADAPGMGETFLAGVGLLEVQQQSDGSLEFDIQVASLGAGTSEQPLVEWLVRHLPEEAVLLGYKLAEHTLPALMQAAAATEPELALELMNRLALLVTGGAIDLANDFGGAGAPKLEDVCRTHGIPAEDMSYDRVFTKWALGGAGCLDQLLATNLVALWRQWIMTAVRDADDRERARAALSCWLSRRPDDLALTHRGKP